MINKEINLNLTYEELNNKMATLENNKIAILMSTDESYIATIRQEHSDEYNYFDFSKNYVSHNFFRDCYLEKNNTCSFVMKIPKGLFLNNADLAARVANIWYYVISRDFPCDRIRLKIRDFNNDCCADFIADTSFPDYDAVIGYINLGKEFNQPEFDSLTKGRDSKGVFGFEREKLEEICEEVGDLIIKELEAEL